MSICPSGVKPSIPPPVHPSSNVGGNLFLNVIYEQYNYFLCFQRRGKKKKEPCSLVELGGSENERER